MLKAPVEATDINVNSVKKSFRKASWYASRMTGSPTGRKAARYQTSFTVGENQPCPVWSKMSPTMSRMKDRIGNTTFGCSSPLLCPQLHPEWQVVLASMIQSVFIIPMQRTEDIFATRLRFTDLGTCMPGRFLWPCSWSYPWWSLRATARPGFLYDPYNRSCDKPHSRNGYACFQ